MTPGEARRPPTVASGPVARVLVGAALLAAAVPVLPSTTAIASADDGLDTLRAVAPADGPDCHPPFDPAQPQWVIGYGSLMQETSRKRTAPNAAFAVPVEVSGYRRGWFAAGQMPGFNTVYLGVAPDAGARLNAVIVDVPAGEIPALDAREYLDCRVAVPAANTRILSGSAEAAVGQAWIYVNKADSLSLPSDQVPIVQSYVDEFLSGCLDLGDANALPDFARNCIALTTDWSPHWVNDRIFPRRPHVYQPNAKRIDTLIAAELPREFAAIRIE